MNALQFLKRLVPNDGTKIIASFDTDAKKFKQYICDSYEDMVRYSQLIDSNKLEAFFALASFKDATYTPTGANYPKPRVVENIKSLKAFWVDIDCKRPDGKGYQYETKREAADAVLKATDSVGLPSPLFIQSGWGVHAYWPLQSEVTYEVWQSVAETFKEKLRSAGLKFDPKRTADGASVLRVIDTQNWKFKDQPKAVKIVQDCPDYDFGELKKVIGVIDVPVIPKELLDVPILNLEVKNTAYPPSRAKKVIGECQQIMWGYTYPEQVSEPFWFHALTVLAHTTDGEKACHSYSRADKVRYNEEDTQKKYLHIKSAGEKGAPALCTTFQRERPDGCKGCPHLNKVKSPIVLGYENPVQQIEVKQTIGNVSYTQTRTLSSIPEPYFGSDKGLFLKKEVVKDGQAVVEFDHILDYPLYLVDVYDDVSDSEVRAGEVIFTYKNPRGTWVDIRFEKSHLDKADKIAEALNRSSLYVVNADTNRIKAFMRAYLQKVYRERANTLMVKHFGWTAESDAFALGKRLFTKDGVKESVPSPKCYPVAEYITQKGSYEEWKKAFNAYFNRPGMELPALVSGVAFGSVLLKFLNEPALVLNIYSPKSGRGKTTTASFISSTFGNPEKLKMRWEDTKTSTNTRSGILSSMPIHVDEIHNTTSEEISKFIYGSSSGRSKNRAMQDGSERANDTVWNNVWLTTSNVSLVGALTNSKGNSNAEQARLIEIDFSNVLQWEFDEAKRITETMYGNYGWALDVFVKYCVENQQLVEQGVRKMHSELIAEYNGQPNERFWFAGMAAILYGCELANQLDITTYNLPALRAQVAGVLAKSRNSVSESTRDVADIIAAFYSDCYGYAVEVTQRTAPVKEWVVSREPRGKFFIRYETDLGKMYVLRSQFNKWCRDNNVESKEFYERARKDGILLEYDNGSSLSKGTSLQGAVQGRNLVFQLKKKGDKDD